MLRHSFPSAHSNGGASHSNDRVAFSALVTGQRVRTIWSALREGHAAHRTYEHLRSQHVPHEPALRAALGSDDPVRTSVVPARAHRKPGVCAVKAPRTCELITPPTWEHPMFWALLPPMAAAPKRSPSKRSESWLVPFRWWMGRDKCREALAAVPDDEISKLSELGRQLRREARHRRFDAVRARPFRLFPRAAAATPSYPAEPGMLRRLLGDVIESRRRRAEREVARYLARLD